MKKLQKRRHYLTTHVAGFTYWEGPMVFGELHIGTELHLEREDDNKFDPYAIALYYDEYKIGYIPREDNEDINKFLEMGWEDVFEVRINRVIPEQHPEQQIGIIVYIKLNAKEEGKEDFIQ
ncbi:MAG: HIRAN domain-containing protein [Bacteroidales bacterium]|jgi:hypothetical protein|nr:HIRAN domain-containing protein [Bacteroidales bacterium]MDD3153062.1 HIRAN domain-containing protein [Bacteroidales bacterium]MDD3913797.1 HIRAN domain-containing protein [Bacteroidales bacterium]MDD4633562.1 HIRAN domain-containing protein [Bacteroidales bacterium]